MLLGYTTWGMPDVPIETAVDHLSALGFDAIEIAVLPEFSTALDRLDRSERQRILRLLNQRNLTLSAVMAYLPLVTEDRERYARDAASIRAAIDLAVDWTQGDQPPVVISGIGGKPGELEDLLPRLVDRLAQLGDYALGRGVTLALEHHIGSAVETPADVRRLMSSVDCPAVRINFDISHFDVLGIPIEESVAETLPYAVHTHVKDERGRAPDFEYLIPGEGDFDYIAYLNAMAAFGYNGTISVEISKMVQRRPGYDPLETATRSYQVLHGAFEDAGLVHGRAGG